MHISVQRKGFAASSERPAERVFRDLKGGSETAVYGEAQKYLAELRKNGWQVRCSSITKLTSRFLELGTARSVHAHLPIFGFAADASHGEALPGYVSLFVHSEHGASRRKNQIVTLYDELRPSLMAYLSGLGLSVHEAEDIIQESFLRLVRHLAGKRDQENLRGWLFRVAHNLTMDLFRAGKRYIAESAEEEASAVLGVADTSLSPEEIAIKQEQLRRVWAAMGRLTQQQRYAVLLRAEGLRYREISAVLGMNTQRVGELLQRALTRLAGDV